MEKVVKREVRILGIDDSPFNKKDKKCLVVGTVFRGGNYIDGLLSCYVKVDGNDSTSQLTKLIKKTKHLQQLQYVMIDGLTLAGFNVVDIKELNKKTKLPVIVVVRRKPNFKKIELALKKVNGYSKIPIIRKAGEVREFVVNNKKIYFQIAGLSKQKAKEILKLTCIHSLLPEPIRVAHLIASGVVLGESRGRA